MGFRQAKINEQVTKELTEILRGVKDYRITNSFVSITDVDVSRDLSLARVFYSVLGNDGGVSDGLESAKGYMRKELAMRLNLRITPKLQFIRDESAQRAMRINELLKSEPKDESGTDE